MADKDLVSNLIIRSRADEPDLKGFKSIESAVDSLARKLAQIEAREWSIKFKIDDTVLKNLGISVSDHVKKAAEEAKKSIQAVSKEAKKQAEAAKRESSEAVKRAKYAAGITKDLDGYIVQPTQTGFTKTTTEEGERIVRRSVAFARNKSISVSEGDDFVTENVTFVKANEKKNLIKKTQARQVRKDLEREISKELEGFLPDFLEKNTVRNTRTARAYALALKFSEEQTLFFIDLVEANNRRDQAAERASVSNRARKGVRNRSISESARKEEEEIIRQRSQELLRERKSARRSGSEGESAFLSGLSEFDRSVLDNELRRRREEFDRARVTADKERKREAAKKARKVAKEKEDTEKERPKATAADKQLRYEVDKRDTRVAQQSIRSRGLNLVRQSIFASNEGRLDEFRSGLSVEDLAILENELDSRGKRFDILSEKRKKLYRKIRRELNEKKKEQDEIAKLNSLVDPTVVSLQGLGFNLDDSSQIETRKGTFYRRRLSTPRGIVSGTKSSVLIDTQKGFSQASESSTGNLAARVSTNTARKIAEEQERKRLLSESQGSLYRETIKKVSQGNFTGFTNESEEFLFSGIASERQSRVAQAKARRDAARRARELERDPKFEKIRDDDNTVSFYSVVRKGIGDLEGRLVSVDRKTGRVKDTMIKGAQAARMLGDSFVHATEKVSLWLGVTSLVFAGISSFRFLSSAIIELESASVLLQRVGRNIGDTDRERIQNSQLLRKEIVQQTTIVGGLTDETLRSAAVFTRAGADRREAIEATKTSLIASKVAEIGAVESAELLSSAYLQFAYSANQARPILDELNQLSNRYRVTTEDLFNSISRSGSIIAQQNGRLTELAAITALTSQVTSRSGSEIGNAIKTIVSNLERVETRSAVLNKLGIYTVELSGKTKTYSQILLELGSAFDNLSESEKNSLSTQIAGVRQRNILITQVKNAIDTFVAEAESLDSTLTAGDEERYGSAISELALNFNTLKTSAERTQAEMVQLAEVFDGPIVIGITGALGFVRSFSDSVQTLNDKTGGLSGNLTSGAVAVSGLASVTGWARRQFLGINDEMLVSFFRSDRLIKSFDMLRMKGLSLSSIKNAFSGIASSLTKASGIAFAIDAAISATVLLVGNAYQAYAEKASKLAELSRDANIASLTEIETNIRKSESFVAAANAVSFLIQEQERLESIGSQSRADKAAEDARKIAEAYKIEIDAIKGKDAVERSVLIERLGRDGRIKTIEEQFKKAREGRIGSQKDVSRITSNFISSVSRGGFGEAYAQAVSRFSSYDVDFEKLRRSDLSQGLKKAISGRNKALAYGPYSGREAIAESELKVAEEYFAIIRKIGEGGEGSKKAIAERKAFLDSVSTSTGGVKNFYGYLVDAGDKILEASKDQAKFNKEIEKLEQLLEKEKSTLDQITEINKRNNIDIQKGLRESLKLKTSQEFFDPVLQPIREVNSPASGFRETQRIMEEISPVVSRISAGVRELTGDFLKNNESVVAYLDLSKKLLGAEIRRFSLVRDAAQSFARTNLQVQSSLANAVADSNRSIFESKNSGTGGSIFPRETESLRKLDTQLASTGETIAKIKERVGIIGDVQGGDGEAEARRIGEIKALELQLAEELSNVSNLEVERAKSLLQAEASITEQKRQQVEEARKSLGLLSEEDKLRVLAQAQYFKENPDKKISQTQQFLASSQNISIAQKYNESRLERPSLDPADPLTRTLGKDFGVSRETIEAEEDITERKRGRTREQIAGEAFAVGSEARARAVEIETGGIKLDTDTGRLREGGGVGQVERGFDITPQLADVRPMIDMFQNIMTDHTERMVKHFEEKARQIFEVESRIKDVQSAPEGT